jgi:hypothetical protein
MVIVTLVAVFAVLSIYGRLKIDLIWTDSVPMEWGCCSINAKSRNQKVIVGSEIESAQNNLCHRLSGNKKRCRCSRKPITAHSYGEFYCFCPVHRARDWRGRSYDILMSVIYLAACCLGQWVSFFWPQCSRPVSEHWNFPFHALDIPRKLLFQQTPTAVIPVFLCIATPIPWMWLILR